MSETEETIAVTYLLQPTGLYYQIVTCFLPSLETQALAAFDVIELTKGHNNWYIRNLTTQPVHVSFLDKDPPRK